MKVPGTKDRCIIIEDRTGGQWEREKKDKGVTNKHKSWNTVLFYSISSILGQLWKGERKKNVQWFVSVPVCPISTALCSLQTNETMKGIKTSTSKSKLFFAENQLTNF